MTTRLIFEDSTSPLYYSNDGRLQLTRVLEDDTRVFVLHLDDAEVFATRDRVKAAAYIAGYDLALARGIADAMTDNPKGR